MRSLRFILITKTFYKLHLLINEMFDKGKYPVQLNAELINRIHEKEEIHFENKYRGISLT